MKIKMMRIPKSLASTLLGALLFCNYSFCQDAKTYEKAYQEEYTDALKFIQTNRQLIHKSLQDFQTDPNVLIAVVFPEVVRFSGVQNMVETASLELLYTRYGTNYANFSIGRFQMKPSFIEALEAYIKTHHLTSLVSKIEIHQTDPKEIRRERIKRLKKLTWQLTYLAVFEQIIQHKFKVPWNNLEHKIHFMAAAYNHGFQDTQDNIEQWIGKKAFPYGPGYKGDQYAYTDIAYDVFLRYLPQILR